MSRSIDSIDNTVPMTSKLSVELSAIDSSVRDQLFAIVSDIDVMRYVGNGNTWNSSKLNTFIQYANAEEKIPNEKRTSFYWAIVVGSPTDSSADSPASNVAGIVGIHLTKYAKWYSTSIFVSHVYQNKGIAHEALRLAYVKFRKHNLADVYFEAFVLNVRANKFAEKCQFSHADNIFIGKKEYSRYKVQFKL